MLAKVCWLMLTGMGLVSGVAAGHGLFRAPDDVKGHDIREVDVEDRDTLQSVASQRYVNNQARHWRALVVNK